MLEQSVSPSLTDDTITGYDLLRFECGRYELKQSALIELRGEDRKGWLQGQTTNNLRSVTNGSSIAFSICAPSGHMIASCEMWAIGERYLVRMAKACLPNFLKRFEQAVILEDVVMEDLSSQIRLLSIQGPTATSGLRQFFETPSLDAGSVFYDGIEILCLRSNRTGMGGWDLLLPRDAEKQAADIESAFEEINDEAYNIARLEAGIPKFGIDMDEKTFPPEMGPMFEQKTISYNKGCYTGQEVLMRIHSRGHTNRTWMGLMSITPLSAGDKVTSKARPAAGFVTSACESPQYGFIAGAMLRNEVAFAGEIVKVITNNGEVEAEVVQMPILRPE